MPTVQWFVSNVIRYLSLVSFFVTFAELPVTHAFCSHALYPSFRDQIFPFRLPLLYFQFCVLGAFQRVVLVVHVNLVYVDHRYIPVSVSDRLFVGDGVDGVDGASMGATQRHRRVGVLALTAVLP